MVVPTSTWTTIASLNVQANHTYLVFAYSSWDADETNVYTVAQIRASDSIVNIRSHDGMYKGGGSNPIAIIYANTDVSLLYRVYQSSGQSQDAVGIKFVVYELD